MLNDLIETVAHTLVNVDDVECIYEDSITKIASVIADSLREITVKITTYEHWQEQKEIILDEFKEGLLEELA